MTRVPLKGSDQARDVGQTETHGDLGNWTLRKNVTVGKSSNFETPRCCWLLFWRMELS